MKKKKYTRKTTTILHMKKDNTTQETTELLQSNSSNNKPKTFSTDKLDKLERLLNLDINILENMVNEYTTKNTTHCSIKVIDKLQK
ncbi:hypothetical protein [Clostridium neonatale]